jgi:hypothetical protein
VRFGLTHAAVAIREMARPQHKLYRRYRHPGVIEPEVLHARPANAPQETLRGDLPTPAVIGHEKPADSSILIDLVTRRRPALMT